MSKLYMYVVARDFGFAPNPFHGVCTLATCKPKIRDKAAVGDWVMGMAGAGLRAVGACVFAMRVDEALSFDAYWHRPEFFCKRPVRNGSRIMVVGDNIYYRNQNGLWHQADSHHSRPDGSPDPSNVANDTQSDRVLVSRRFSYFGENALIVPAHLLQEVNYRNGRGHRVIESGEGPNLRAWLRAQVSDVRVLGDPFHFRRSGDRYSAGSNRVIKIREAVAGDDQGTNL